MSDLTQDVTVAAEKQMADLVRRRITELRNAIIAARELGLTVQIPQNVSTYLDFGTATGSPDDWIIFAMR